MGPCAPDGSASRLAGVMYALYTSAAVLQQAWPDMHTAAADVPQGVAVTSASTESSPAGSAVIGSGQQAAEPRHSLEVRSGLKRNIPMVCQVRGCAGDLTTAEGREPADCGPTQPAKAGLGGKAVLQSWNTSRSTAEHAGLRSLAQQHCAACRVPAA